MLAWAWLPARASRAAAQYVFRHRPMGPACRSLFAFILILIRFWFEVPATQSRLEADFLSLSKGDATPRKPRIGLGKLKVIPRRKRGVPMPEQKGFVRLGIGTFWDHPTLLSEKISSVAARALRKDRRPAEAAIRNPESEISKMEKRDRVIAGQRIQRRSARLREVGTNELFVIAGVEAAVRESGMRPDDEPATIFVGRFEEVGAAELFIALRAEVGNDEIAEFVEEEKPITVLDDKGVSPADPLAGGGGLERFPDALAGLGFEAAELTIAANAVDIAILEKGCAEDRVQVSSVFLADFLRAPKRGGSRFAGIELKHERAIVKGGEEEPIIQLARGGHTETHL